MEGSYGTMRLTQPSPEGALFTEQTHQWSLRGGVSVETGLGSFSLSAYQNTTYLRGVAIAQDPPYFVPGT